jgi:hypothetical protein
MPEEGTKAELLEEVHQRSVLCISYKELTKVAPLPVTLVHLPSATRKGL